MIANIFNFSNLNKHFNQSIKDWRSYDLSKNEWLQRKIFKNNDIPFKMKSIESHCFVDFKNLEELNLDSNNLIKVETNSFQHLSKLKKFDLGWYQIEQIDSNGFQGLDT